MVLAESKAAHVPAPVSMSRDIAEDPVSVLAPAPVATNPEEDLIACRGTDPEGNLSPVS